MKVLVTGMFTQAGIFAVRNFAAKGFYVYAADCHPLAYGMYSKHIKKRFFTPNLRENPIAYCEAIIKILRQESIDYFFPTFEEIFALSRFRESVLELTKTVIPTYDELISLHDKAFLNKAAHEAGIATPETFAPKSFEELPQIFEKIDYPVVIKLRQTRNSTGLRYVENPREIPKYFQELVDRNELPEDSLPIIQRWLKGKLYCTLELCDRGSIVGEVVYTGLRSYPRGGGTTVYRASVSSPECEKTSAKIVKHTNWSGFIGFDFILEEDGKPFLIDANPRCSVAINMAYYGGGDMIAEWLKIADGNRAEKRVPCREGVKTKTHFADVIWLAGTYFGGNESRAERRQMRKKWWSDNEFHHDIDSAKDIMPTIILWLFLIFQSVKLFYTNLEAGQLFLYYNQFDEENLKKQLVASNKAERALDRGER